ncbi:MAG: hypothetical protein IT345_10765 [Trueperaceae bacterium]|nr:hypothetical protein [Trueperaceae bacterium]
MQGVRFREDVGFEGQCDYCLEYWPIDQEFWYPKHGMRACRGCLREMKKTKLAVRRLDPEKRARDREGSYENRELKKDMYREAQQAWYVRNRERLLAEKRAKYRAEREAAGHKPSAPLTPEDRVERLRAARAKYHELNREKRNMANRLRYIEQKLARGAHLTERDKADRARAYNRDWMRRKRAEVT